MNELPLDTKQLRSFHLFAGAGGGILADLLLGHRVVGACEIEEYPRNVLLQRQRDGILPEFPIWDDICTLDGRPWRGRVDVISGGFPCQDISCAGKGAGIDGERSGMWKHMARIVGEVRPRYVFVENSKKLQCNGSNDHTRVGAKYEEVSEFRNSGGTEDVAYPLRERGRSGDTRRQDAVDADPCGKEWMLYKNQISETKMVYASIPRLERPKRSEYEG
jgi:site-specific DNA-cytosine methylase